MAIPPQGAPPAYTSVIAGLGHTYHADAEAAVAALRFEEGNLRHALDLARVGEHWDEAVGCLQGLHILYLRTGRGDEWAQIVKQITADFTNPETGGPYPGRDEGWSLVVGYRAELACTARDWPLATVLENTSLAYWRDRASAAFTVAPGELTPGQRTEIHNVAACLHDLGNIFFEQGDPGCLPHYQEALRLSRLIGTHNEETGGRNEEAETAIDIGNVYAEILEDLDQAEEWYRYSLDHREDDDWLGQAKSLGQLADVACRRSENARAAGAYRDVPKYLDAALHGYQDALGLLEVDDDENLAIAHHQIGRIHAQPELSERQKALDHFQQSLLHAKACGHIYRVGKAHFNIAALYAADCRYADALPYARTALADFESVGPGAVQVAARTRHIVTKLELINLGDAHTEARRFDEAADAYEKAATICQHTGDLHVEAETRNRLGRALTQVRRFGDAINAHRKAARIFRDTGYRHSEGWVLVDLGTALTGARRFNEAVTECQKAVTIFQDTRDRYGERRALLKLGEACGKLWQWDDMLAAYQQATAILQETGDRRASRKALIALGCLRGARKITRT